MNIILKCSKCNKALLGINGDVEWDEFGNYVCICGECLEELGIKLCCGIPMYQYSSSGYDTYKCTKCGRVTVDDD